MDIDAIKEYDDIDEYLINAVNNLGIQHRPKYPFSDFEMISRLSKLIGIFTEHVLKTESLFNSESIGEPLSIIVMREIARKYHHESTPGFYYEEATRKGTNIAREMVYLRYYEHGRELHVNVLDEILCGNLDESMIEELKPPEEFRLFLPAAIITAALLLTNLLEGVD